MMALGEPNGLPFPLSGSQLLCLFRLRSSERKKMMALRERKREKKDNIYYTKKSSLCEIVSIDDLLLTWLLCKLCLVSSNGTALMPSSEAGSERAQATVCFHARLMPCRAQRAASVCK